MNDTIDLRYKNFKEILISVLVGFSIGLSVIVPGISGSAIAIIMKVYDKMMFSFSNIFKKFKPCVMFLIPIVIGVCAGFGIGFVLVKLLLEAIPFITICFFVGLMVGTFPILFKEIRGAEATMNRKILFALGILIPLAITVISLVASGDNSLINLNFGHYMLFLFLGIMISLTQIIPGLSATVLLMIFGYYTALLNSVGSEMFKDFGLLLVFIMLGVGFIVGLLLFSKLINHLLDNKRTPFFFTICGLSVGSMLAVFFGDECVDIYCAWETTRMIVDLSVGVVALALGFAATFALYLYEKKKSGVQGQEEKKAEKINEKN